MQTGSSRPEEYKDYCSIPRCRNPLSAKEEAPRNKLWRLLPVRRSKKGIRTGINSMEEEEKHTKWVFRRLEFSEEEKRQILAEVIYHAVKTDFKNNMYQFQGEVRIHFKEISLLQSNNFGECFALLTSFVFYSRILLVLV